MINDYCNKGEALTSPCVGQRPTPIDQHPYQALKGRHHGMGNGCRPFRACEMGWFFSRRALPCAGGWRPFRACGHGQNHAHLAHCLNHDLHDLRIGRMFMDNHVHHLNHIKITVQTNLLPLQRRNKTIAK